MNKKRNYARTMLLGALLCGIAGPAFVGCKDYDDDIDNLQVQIDENRDAIAALQKLVDGGAIVTSVESDGNGGVIIKLSDGTEHHITKGEKGDQGDEGIQGLPGDPGAVPTFKIENGELMYTFESGDNAQWTSVGKVEADAPQLNFEVDETTGDLMLNGESIGHVKGDKGEQGAPAAAVQLKFEVRADGYLYYSTDNGTTWTKAGEVKGSEASIPNITFTYDEEQGLMYQVGTEVAKPIAGFDMAAIIADNVKLTVNEAGNLCLNGEEVTPAIQIGSNIFIVEDEYSITLNIPSQQEDGTFVNASVVLPTTDIFAHMITSVDFVPISTDGDLKMYKLTSKVGDNKEFIATSSQLRFRVSPSTAVYDKDYTIASSMEYVLARSAGALFTATYNEKMTTESNDGLVYVDFKFDENQIDVDKEYILALALNDLHNDGRVIYSDNIVFDPDATDLTADWQAVDKEGKLSTLDKLTLVWEANSTLDIAKALAYAAHTGDSKFATLDVYGFEGVTYTVEFASSVTDEQKEYYSINGTVISLNDVTYQSKGEFKVKVTAKLGEDVLDTKEVTINVGEAEIPATEHLGRNLDPEFLQHVQCDEHVRYALRLPYDKGRIPVRKRKGHEQAGYKLRAIFPGNFSPSAPHWPGHRQRHPAISGLACDGYPEFRHYFSHTCHRSSGQCLFPRNCHRRG